MIITTHHVHRKGKFIITDKDGKVILEMEIKKGMDIKITEEPRKSTLETKEKRHNDSQ